jgi:ketosteroid isomerase-like protein
MNSNAHPAAATPAVADVLTAADALIEAFAATDTEAYFASFAPEATFVFHPEPRTVLSKAEYQTEWAGWLESGWSVAAVESTERRVDLFGSVAVFTHRVSTTTVTQPAGQVASTTTVEERETIVFAADANGVLLAVHEHLSPAPSSG